jgi:hypothetical protein
VRVCYRIRQGMVDQYSVNATENDFKWPIAAGKTVKVVDGDPTDNTMIADRRTHPDAELCTDLPSFVNAVKNGCDQKKNSIGLLYVCGHGAPGIQAVGGGRAPRLTTMMSVDRWGNLRQTALLGQLTALFTSEAIVRLDGCNVAQCWRGKALLYELAKLWNVRVQGGTVTQYNDPLSKLEGTEMMEAVPPSKWHRITGLGVTYKGAVKIPLPLPGDDGTKSHSAGI